MPRCCKLVKRGEAIYGVNTGFGKLAKARIADRDLDALQINLVRSHAAGTGEALAPDTVRLIMVLKLKSLARGYSGIHPATAAALAGLINADVIPVIPAQGSVGASGDLAPLAHLALVLIGEGEAMIGGRRMSGAAALRLGETATRGARAQGRAGAPERHPGVDRHRAACADRRGTDHAGRGGGRRHVGRRHQGQRHAVRSAHPCHSPASGPGGAGRPSTAGCSRAAPSAPRT